ncbi:P-loop containing nucleoside triphosphate hydrolase protein [Staphylotrichum tortipilum]|uniref:P-loop containing nucleoside triphosphate hydrolase protein n=1 Tax=Staphylotrichum tortipilum TaxID=2831512 RepID=A0AAN6MBF7_9PEZI|nr:P-loop containing nucleoside triphosphate hydrolase protein [Staphylotrichum longicolle]
MKSLEFRIRKLHVNTDADRRLQKKQPSRVYVNEEALIELTGTRDGGRAVCLERVAASPDDPPVRREATLWKAPERLDKSVTQMYDAFRDACAYKLGEHVRITSLGGPLPDAERLVLQQLSPAPATAAPDGSAPETQPQAVPPPPEDIPGWECFLAGRLSQIEHVHAGLVLKNLFLRGPERSFVVASVNGRATGNARYHDRRTAVSLATTSDSGEGRGAAAGDLASRPRLEVTGIRGLDTQVAQLNGLLNGFDAPVPFDEKPFYSAIVIHGGHGTGKTMLLNAIAAAGWGTVFRIQYKDKLAEIQEIFQKASLQQPSVVLIDQLDRLIDKDRSNRAAVILALCEALDALATDADAKHEMPKVAVVATCLDYTTDVPEDLKEPDRMTSEIYLPMPDAEGRREILAALRLGVAPDQEQDLLRQLSERTHAYNGKDLRRLVGQARVIGRLRHSKTPAAASLPSPDDSTSASPESSSPPPPPLVYYHPSDYHEALRLVRPSAMHDINLKPPPIRWDDIGGQESVKLSLRRAVRLSVESPEVLSRYFDRPPKGFLLYGPPGCSKTMAAQAMATESGLNFFAVKGAELLNMYVGESERAVRRLFQRAREVSPSMIFFDEIDSIAGQRSGFSHSSSSPSSSGGSGSGINVLTTLLNEMDGFEALHGVVVLAATNRPQALDPALLRPGRFDELIYVSPPDEPARRAIFSQVAARRAMHADVDVDRLARDTEGYSGAEIKGICAAAGVAAYDRFAAGGEPAIMMQDLERGIRNQKRQITAGMLRGFEEWERQFRKF